MTLIGKAGGADFKGKLHARYLAFLCTLYICFCHPASRPLRHLSRLIRSREYIVSLACACFCFDLDVGPEAKALRPCSPRSPVSVEPVCFVLCGYNDAISRKWWITNTPCWCILRRRLMRPRCTGYSSTGQLSTEKPHMLWRNLEHALHTAKQATLHERRLIQTRSSSPGRGRRR